MSNRLHLIATKFVDLPDESVSFGYRIFDDCFMEYANHWEPYTVEDDLKFFADLLAEDDMSTTAKDAIDFHLRGPDAKGMYINGCWYMPDQLLPILDASAEVEEEVTDGNT